MAIRDALGLRSVGRRPDSADSCRPELLGWPLAVLAPQNTAPCIGYWGSALTAFTTGWLFYCLVAPFGPPGRQSDLVGVCLFFGVFTCYIAFAHRATLYGMSQGYRPPVSGLGRIVTGRLIIPGHDKAYLALFLSLVPQFVLLSSGAFGRRPDIVGGTAIALSCFILLALGPSLPSWRMTGRYNLLAPPKGLKQKLTKL